MPAPPPLLELSKLHTTFSIPKRKIKFYYFEFGLVKKQRTELSALADEFVATQTCALHIPTTSALSGMSVVTTVPAPIITLFPILIYPITVTLLYNTTLFPIIGIQGFHLL